MRRLAWLGGLAALYLTMGAPLHAQPAASALPPGEGRDLLNAACAQCHSLAPIVSIRDGAAGWRSFVYNMVLRGAQLTTSESETVIQYLAANFGPSSQLAATPAAAPLPSGAGKELVEARCATCHDLGRVTAVRRNKSDWDAMIANMVDRGAPMTPDEIRTISAYLVAQFGSY